MQKRMVVSLCLVALALVTLGASDSCKAPMDATGDYSGTWSITVKEGEGEEATTRTVECDSLRMTLDQDVNLEYPDNLTVTGTLFIDDYSCLEDANWPELIPLPEPGEVKVTGTMGPSDKRIILGSGGIGTGAGAIFGLDGFGESADPTGDDIPEMTGYAGTWGLAVSIVFIGTGGVAGEFAVERD
jgi:hypothetical protein